VGTPHEASNKQVCFELVSWLVNSSTVMMEAIHRSERRLISTGLHGTISQTMGLFMDNVDYPQQRAEDVCRSINAGILMLQRMVLFRLQT
jgi:hypothetical protein